MMESTAGRVPAHTAEPVNRKIRRETEANIQYYRAHPDEIAERLGEIDREWDIERTLKANAATILLFAILFGLAGSRKWLLLAGMVAAFLLQHAVEGWCPPLPLFRRMGVRTQTEIERERFALLALRNQPERVH